MGNFQKKYHNDINKFINEEVQKFLNETVTSVGGHNNDNLKFTQIFNMPNIGFNNYGVFTSDYDAQIIDAMITINWSINFIVNELGVQSFQIRGDSVEGSYLLELRDKQTDEVKQKTQKNINETEWKFTVPQNIGLIVNGTLYPKALYFDFSKSLCTIDFQTNGQ